ncbi:hypothetical protein LUZ61_007558 [Rhynchospora tenuis]|uniref:CASP-like protein n=1 Tax=Rhynchospora tenuis TaxID=198213 RepID=A0AAD5ZTV5_9POAL|nr:hypothetical protein LUZ61_007558 [Rhynchospora tenuis]
MDYAGNEQPPVAAPPLYMQQQRVEAQVINVPPSIELLECIPRGAAIVTTFIAAVVMGTSKETVTVVTSTYDVNVTVKTSSFSALKYFVAANAITLIYSIVSLLISLLIKSKPIILRLSIAIVDIVAVSMLLTGNGAAIAISTQLDNVDSIFAESTCSVYDAFCSKVKASISMSMFAVGLYLVLVILSLVTFAYRRN